MKNIHWDRALEAPPEQFHDRLVSVLHALPEQEETTMKKAWNMKRVGALALAAVLVLSIGAAAGNNLGFIRSEWRTTDALADPAAVVKALESGDVEGITSDAKFLEAYSNGFAFAGATLGGQEARTNDDPTVYSYQTVDVWYERDGAKVYVDISPVLPGISDGFDGTESECGDVTLYALEQNYLVVPLDYEKTPEQVDAEAAGTLVFSYDDCLTGPEAVVQRYVSWLQDGMCYSVNAIDSMTELTELIAMAQELINS